MVLATWNCLAIPLEIAFEPPVAENVFWIIGNLFIDFFFLVDIVLTFRTTYINSNTGDEITEPKKIAISYLKGRFVIDVLSTIPFDLFTGNTKGLEFFSLFGLLKVMRVFRLGKIINFINARDDVKMTLKLLKLVFFLVLYIHCVGCTWYWIVKKTEIWIAPLDYMYVKTDLYTKSLFHRYMNSFYHAVLMLNGNELGPRDNTQLAFVSLILVLGAIINANIFGNMAVIIQELNKKASRFQEKIDIANTAMKNMKLPGELQ